MNPKCERPGCTNVATHVTDKRGQKVWYCHSCGHPANWPRKGRRRKPAGPPLSAEDWIDSYRRMPPDEQRWACSMFQNLNGTSLRAQLDELCQDRWESLVGRIRSEHELSVVSRNLSRKDVKALEETIRLRQQRYPKLTLAAIGKRLHITEHAVKQRLKRARDYGLL